MHNKNESHNKKERKIMTEITTTDARLLTPEETTALIRFMDFHHGGYWNSATYGGMPLQGVLNLWHKSIEYVDLDSWMEDWPDAEETWKLQFTIKDNLTG